MDDDTSRLLRAFQGYHAKSEDVTGCHLWCGRVSDGHHSAPGGMFLLPAVVAHLSGADAPEDFPLSHASRHLDRPSPVSLVVASYEL